MCMSILAVCLHVCQNTFKGEWIEQLFFMMKVIQKCTLLTSPDTVFLQCQGQHRVMSPAIISIQQLYHNYSLRYRQSRFNYIATESFAIYIRFFYLVMNIGVFWCPLQQNFLWLGESLNQFCEYWSLRVFRVPVTAMHERIYCVYSEKFLRVPTFVDSKALRNEYYNYCKFDFHGWLINHKNLENWIHQKFLAFIRSCVLHSIYMYYLFLTYQQSIISWYTALGHPGGGGKR